MLVKVFVDFGQSFTYEGNISWKCNDGYLNIFRDQQLIATFDKDCWKYVMAEVPSSLT